MKKIILLMCLAIFLVSCANNDVDVSLYPEMVVFKSPNCGCCGVYASTMESNGLSVNVIMVDDMNAIKQEKKISSDMESCHTAEIGGYFVEGHVPLEAIDKLLSEQPDLDGIALPGMPSGSPGMPGPKRGDWVIYGIKDGVASEFMVI